MSIGLVGRKCGMTRIYNDAGAAVPVTVIEALPNRVSQVKSEQHEGYAAIQVTTGSRRASRVTKAKVAPGSSAREFRIGKADQDKYAPGAEIKVDIFSVGQVVDVTGTTIGKGFAGTMKRHNFKGGRKTHGNSVSHRSPGSIGQRQTPGRVFKGKRMSGHMGVVNRTIENLKVVQIDAARNLLLISGAVPGAEGGRVIVRPSVKAVGQARRNKLTPNKAAAPAAGARPAGGSKPAKAEKK